MAALAEALKEVSVTKAQLGLELEELEAAARLVQEEETALKAAHSASRQQTPCSSSEASDSEESDSSTSSEAEDSDSEHEELKDSTSETLTCLQDPFLEESSALLIDDGGLCRNAASLGSDAGQGKPLASSRALGGPGPLIEELGEQLKATVQMTETEGSAAGDHSSMQAQHDRQTPND